MALKHIMINDIISEHNARIQNLKRYYPFFVLNETVFSQYRDGKFEYLDMGYITLATLRFFINENNFNERDIAYEEYEKFLIELLRRDFLLDTEPEEEKQLVSYIFDKLKNNGRAFEFKFFDPETRTSKITRVKLIDSKLTEDKVMYTVTAEGIEFYLDTKEIKDESKINISQLLLEKMITSDNFKGGIDVVRRINSQVKRLRQEKEQVLKLFGIDVYEGIKAYDSYMATTGKWFSDEQKLFAKNKALVDKAIERAAQNNQEKSLKSRALEEISELETELKQTIYSHSELIQETMELQQLSDSIINRAKLKKLRAVFDFSKCLNDIMDKDKPELMQAVLFPLFLPKTEKLFTIKAIDDLINIKHDDGNKGEKIENKNVDFDFKYEDETLDEQIAVNYSRLFVELLDQLQKWNKVTLTELIGIYEIKFGEDIYINRDFYSYLVNLAGKQHYSMKDMLVKQETILEGMVVDNISEYYREKYKDIEFDIAFTGEEMQITDNQYITDMYFERSIQRG